MNKVKMNNPIPELISDEVFDLLSKEGLLNETGIRNYLIQTKFRELKELNIGSSEAIGIIKNEYPNLEQDTINKIVYKKNITSKN